MKTLKSLYLTICFSALCSGEGYAQSTPMLKERLEPISFVNVQFGDFFWSPKIKTNRTVSIPSAFKECQKNGRFDNFALAAGLQKGEHKGDFSFDDTDPYKIIEGASYTLASEYDKKLDAYLDSVISLIAGAQEPDGYLCTCVTNKCTRLSGWWGTRRWERINSHELYNCGHLYEAAVAHYQATGKKTLLNVAIKNADLICKVFGPGQGQIHRPSGHPIVEMALCKLYKVTGKKEYLELAKYFIEETGRGTDGHHLSQYSQDHKPILEQDEIVGHAVRAGYLYSGVADVAGLTQDTAYFNALCRIWENMVTKKLYITGGIGSRAQGEGFGPNYELNNHTAYCETCASIANVYWNERMFLATGHSRYIDVLERALYNGVISGVSLSGDKFFYDNPLESMGQHSRQPWFGCACCPGNITRFMASVPGYAYATYKHDFYVNLFIRGDVKVKTDSLDMMITQRTSMPWDGGTTLFISTPQEQKCTFRLRVPAWLTDTVLAGSDLYHYVPLKTKYKLIVNGSSRKAKVENGYLVIDGVWKEGDRIDFDFPLYVRRITAHSQVEDNRGKMVLQRGPLVYCIEGKDQLDSMVFNKYFRPESLTGTEFYRDVLGGVQVIKGEMQQVAATSDAPQAEKKVPFIAIPYYTWNNRGNDQMAVWIPTSAQTTRPMPQPTIASRARSVMIKAPLQKDAPVSASTQEWAWGVNDQWEPKNSHDTSKPYFYWWLKNGTQETLVYTFDRPETVSSIAVYWLDMEHYDGNFRVPQSWKLYYKENDKWKEVEALSPYEVKKDCYNTLNFKSVQTTSLKIEVQLQKGQSGGILEWKVNE